MSQQIQITGGAKVRNLQDVIIGTSGVLSSVAFDVSNGVPRLDVNGKILVSQLPNSVMEYKGTWSAATNTPTLANGTGNQGDVYLCNVAGTVNFGAGAIAFVVGDQVIYSGSIWQRASGATGTVTSVAITESGDSLNITGSPITTSGTINIGFNGTNLQYVNGAGNLTTFPTLTGYVPYTGATQDVDLGAFSLNGKSLHIKGTAGNGHLGLKHQSAAATGSANESLIYADTLGDLNWLNGNLYLSKFITSSNTANRSYTFPNATCNIPDNSLVVHLAGTETITGAKTFSSNPIITNSSSAYIGINSATGTSSSVAFSVNNTNVGFISVNASQFAFRNYVSNEFRLVDGFMDNGGILAMPSASLQTYTFPNATGTIALTSDLTGYVPYSGATGAVNLGAFDLTVNGIKVGIGGGSGANNTRLGSDTLSSLTTASNNVAIGASALFSVTSGNGNVGIGSSALYELTTGAGNTAIGFAAGLSITTGSYNTIIGKYVGTATLDSNVVLADGVGNIRFQWDGTNILLNGNIVGSNAYTSTAYLPLTGGTLTGALSGTSATFSGNIISQGTYIDYQNTSYIRFSNSGGGTRWGYIQHDGTNMAFANDISGGIFSFNKAATFSSTVASKGLVLLGASGGYTTGDNTYINLAGEATPDSFGAINMPFGDAMKFNSYHGFQFRTSNSTASLVTMFSIGINGAATFNASITINGNSSGSTSYLNYQTDGTNVGIIGSDFAIGGGPKTDFSMYAYASGNLLFYTGNLVRLKITSGGNVGIGTSSPTDYGSSYRTLEFNAPSFPVFNMSSGGTRQFSIIASASESLLGTFTNTPLQFWTNSTERMRITSGGFTKASNTGGYINSVGAYHEINNLNATSGDINLVLALGANTSNTSSYFLLCGRAGVDNMYIYGNGNIVNTNGSYGTLSDITLKENIIDATPKLADILNLKVRNFNLIGDDTKQIGFIAQEFEQIFPSMIDIDGKSGKKAIKTSVLVPMLVKAIQEQQVQIEELKALIATK